MKSAGMFLFHLIVIVAVSSFVGSFSNIRIRAIGQRGGIWNQAEMSEIRARKQIGIGADESAQNRLGHHFRAHRTVQKKLQVPPRPTRHLSRLDAA